MSDFLLYFQLGLGHILNLNALDHLLFILSFLIGLNLSKLQKSIYLVSAFTLGHSITLALATLKIVEINVKWIEFLIPLTIALSAILNIVNQKKDESKIKFFLIGAFGLIHGLGFSNYLQSLLGREATILIPLLGFNIGVEIAQILVVTIILSIFTFGKHLKEKANLILQYILSIAIILLSLQMAIERWP